jgi:hypothetical protein
MGEIECVFHCPWPKKDLFMFSSRENFAIHIALLFSLTAEKAAEVAGVCNQTINDALLKIFPKIRGRTIDYGEYLAPNARPDRDSFRLDKEVQLAQLQHQHDECLSAWTISVEHARILFEQHKKLATPDSAPPKKPFVGDIRFLQLAKHLRREMDKIEQGIAKHIQELADKAPAQKSEDSNTSDSPASSEVLTSQASPHAKEQSPDRSISAKPLPAMTAARVATVKSPIETSPTPPIAAAQAVYKCREIPTIEPPPRKRDKYAGVNR